MSDKNMFTTLLDKIQTVTGCSDARETVGQFELGLTKMQSVIHQTAVEHGWWETERPDAESLILIVSEISEIVEALRNGNPMSDKLPGFTQVEEETADVVIRVLNWSEHKGFNISAAILAKMAYNENRPYRHGGKAF